MVINSVVVGTVVASKNVNEFEFVIENQVIDKIKKGEFVITKNTHGDYLLSKITKIVSVNALIGDKSEDASELAKIRGVIYSEEMLNNSSKFLASAKILGVINNESGSIESNVYPINVPQNVYLTKDDLLAKIFSMVVLK